IERERETESDREREVASRSSCFILAFYCLTFYLLSDSLDSHLSLNSLLFYLVFFYNICDELYFCISSVAWLCHVIDVYEFVCVVIFHFHCFTLR
uniref:Uncharacterized protein n=1 Tax=Seriola lalandi dorsalis TaxID=1841481 RepID=A0A3B4YFT2_SERLL